MNPSLKTVLAVVGGVAACFASGVGAIELSRPLVRAEIARMLREVNVATQRDVDRILAEIRELRASVTSR